ncbi:enoyl-CoA hydratase/isomerase family protein [Stakelama tenebrarum]|uniref:Enoyl-CoA hydratase n=1 Tax=Stakelama tenebrarum TaxID=2711215 RepID=A0A6G6Y772_9SPHN|nr:enoyl-CoA hydratase-related protein [Sphingosinithalassobacter tenebrarum]QIG80759.1 enoyl-CoA hydratase [Sphingosinithalassobacter tenebrarum]
MTDSILLERDNGVARITLNRPDVGNALDIPMSRALMEAAIEVDEDDSVRCVLITGAGKLFCAGGDVAAFSGAGEKLPAFLKEITAYVHAAVTRFARMDKPVVTAVNGSVAGAGIGLAILGDIALADPRASYMLAYTAIGLSPDGGTTWMLPRLIGLRRAQELCLRNRRIGAAEAAEIGLATRMVDEGALMDEANALAAELAASATPALGVTRKLLLDSTSNSLEAQLEAESRGISGLARTPQGKEGVASFVEKRKPDFTKGH